MRSSGRKRSRWKIGFPNRPGRKDFNLEKSIASKLFFIFRATSVFADEIWIFAVPLYFFSLGVQTFDLGTFTSLVSLGDLAGFVLLPLLISRFRANFLTIACDAIQFVLMCTIAALAFFHLLDREYLYVAAPLIGILYALWFGATDVVFARTGAPIGGLLFGYLFSEGLSIGPMYLFAFAILAVGALGALKVMSSYGDMVKANPELP